MKFILAFSSISSLVFVASASPLDIPPIKKVGVCQYNCDATSVSDMPWNVFQVVAQNFCKEANEGPDVFELTLDSQGFRKLDVDKRTPPPNLGAYFDYGVSLRKNGSSNIKSEGCTQAYNLLQMSEFE
ncbi:hypothetical protein CKAH01_08631 [Colletotrichum kahawae]|uniref:Uncharacterized protein n=1 Tax=Colletotrichum kahawae TaxID=34407 RepID=A0AAE0D062_COLKA|nr:hypothetical protein CKAH01_08631 [Colletotrichum kahawae]